MNKKFLVLFALILAIGLAFVGVFQNVQAYQLTNNNPGPNTPTPTIVANVGPADGDWTAGKEVSIDLSKIKPPKSYLQQLGDAIEMTKGSRICHPFHGGTYGWSGSIYQYVSGKWVKVSTYYIWEPDSEGTFMACTFGIRGGIYALFGSYNEKANPTATGTATATPTKTATPKPTAKPQGVGTPMPRT